MSMLFFSADTVAALWMYEYTSHKYYISKKLTQKMLKVHVVNYVSILLGLCYPRLQ